MRSRRFLYLYIFLFAVLIDILRVFIFGLINLLTTFIFLSAANAVSNLLKSILNIKLIWLELRR